MHMFMGEYNHTIDAKGRVIVPAKLREDLGEQFVVTKGLDHCLFVYPNDEWQAFAEKLRKLPMTSKDSRNFQRFFMAGAITAEVDKQGRILLSQSLREHAMLDKDVVLIGMTNRVEIWDKNRWNELNSSIEDNMEEVSESLTGLGLTF